MDPNTALANARVALARIRTSQDAGADASDSDAIELADAFEAIDGWLTRGGFLPADWAR